MFTPMSLSCARHIVKLSHLCFMTGNKYISNKVQLNAVLQLMCDFTCERVVTGDRYMIFINNVSLTL